MGKQTTREIKHVDAWIITLFSIPVWIVAFVYMPPYSDWSGNPQLFFAPEHNGRTLLEVKNELSREKYTPPQEVADRMLEFDRLEKQNRALGTDEGDEAVLKVQWARHRFLMDCYNEAVEQGKLSKSLFFGSLAERSNKMEYRPPSVRRAFRYMKRDLAKMERILFDSSS